MTRKEYNKAVDLHADGLYRFILKSMKDSDSAKDVVQDVFGSCCLLAGGPPESNFYQLFV